MTRKTATISAAAVIAVVLPFAMSGSQLSTATFVAIVATGAVGMNLLTGYTGQISLGQAFFLAVGAYTGAVLGADHGFSAVIWIPAAGIVAGACGALIGPAALRVKGLYLAIVTLGLVFVGQHIFFNVDSISGGPQGRAFPPVVIGPFDFAPGQVLQVGGVTIDRDGLYYYLALAILAAAMVYVANLTRTRLGRAMQAVRERELAASVLGVDVARVKIAAFAISSALAGVSGALYASYLGFVQPGQWSVMLSIEFVAAIIVGGMGTAAGPLLGSIVVFALPSVLKSLPLFDSEGIGGVALGDVTAMVYGLLIVVFLVFEPKGLVGVGARVRRWFIARAAQQSTASAVINRGERAT